ncbi:MULTISPECIES: DEAD/DEAH box helicase [unclassified Stenotrophomonas]|nr:MULTISPECIES: DEAD/DEAH box helicase [unclassified Stenotrophomonas]
MKPEAMSEGLLANTRILGKLQDIGMPDEAKLFQSEFMPDPLLVLAIGALGDAAASVNAGVFSVEAARMDALEFAAKFFDSYLEAKLHGDLFLDISVLASASYLIAQRPGSSLVLIKRIQDLPSARPVMRLLIWVLRGEWQSVLHAPELTHDLLEQELVEVHSGITAFFLRGRGDQHVESSLSNLRARSYAIVDDYDLLLVDLLCACVRIRVHNSTWRQLPLLAGSGRASWQSYLESPLAPKELWPSQIKIGQAGMFSGKSGVVQMPTSAGKTKAIELIIRSAFIAKRTSSVVIIAPFRALCREIAAAMRESFADIDVAINEATDAPQIDFVESLQMKVASSILVVTPEKYLYMLRNSPEAMPDAGLVVYDEGHQFDSGARGVTYELLVTEIKSLVSKQAQVVLVSAVIKNAHSLAAWLIGPDAVIVDGAGISPTDRVIAFATWLEEQGGLEFFDVGRDEAKPFDVPGVIRSSVLKVRARERKIKLFPDKDGGSDVALYLALRLVASGAVAIFCGKKDSAEKIAERLLEVYARGFSLPDPGSFSDPNEIAAISLLASKHFGADSIEARSAHLGMLLHHSGVPEGLRLASEHAVRRGLVKMVVCTSTLAQGVNLPIRYLIVSSIFQGEARMRTRDFQNLMGRAGRSGMHTEGTIVFPDTQVYDNRSEEPWKLKRSFDLIDPAKSEELGSSLRTIVEGIRATYAMIDVTSSAYFSALLEQDGANAWVEDFAAKHKRAGLDVRVVSQELEGRRALLASLQSYLMANGLAEDSASLVDRASQLASKTLAYFTANDSEKSSLIELFEAVALDIERNVGGAEDQLMLSRTLLGTVDAIFVREWVEAGIESLRECRSDEQFLRLLWPLFKSTCNSKLLKIAKPDNVMLHLAEKWVEGASYEDLIAIGAQATRPWGTQKRKITKPAVMAFIEGALSYECVLVTGAVRTLLDKMGAEEDALRALDVFQKRLKYGLPDMLSISIYEAGYSDRVVSLSISSVLREKGYPLDTFNRALVNSSNIREAIEDYPSYFRSVSINRT